jgi:hypothetical protein
MRATLFLPVFLLLGVNLMSCQVAQDEPMIVGPEPEPRVNYLGRDSIATGNYRGIAINGSTDETLKIRLSFIWVQSIIILQMSLT